jgi:hypothetical protein
MHTGGNQLLSWIKAKAQKKIVDTIKDEIERFVASSLRRFVASLS